MKIIVTGASGFVGRNLLISFPQDWDVTALFYQDTKFLSFLEQGRLKNVKPFRADLRQDEEVRHLFAKTGNSFDVCVYLTAKVDIPGSVTDPVSDMQYNTQSTLNFLRHFRGGKFIYMSSGAVYDGLIGRVDPETRLNPTLPYAISKYTSELYVKSYHNRQRSFDKYVILRFFGAYGPYESPKKIFTKLINSFYLKKESNFSIYGDGRNLIDVMYIEDTVRGLLMVMKSEEANLTVDFTKGEPQTIEELVSRTARILGREKTRLRKDGIAHEHNLFFADPSRMERLFGFRPEITYEEGIKKFASFLKVRDSHG